MVGGSTPTGGVVKDGGGLRGLSVIILVAKINARKVNEKCIFACVFSDVLGISTELFCIFGDLESRLLLRRLFLLSPEDIEEVEDTGAAKGEVGKSGLVVGLGWMADEKTGTSGICGAGNIKGFDAAP